MTVLNCAGKLLDLGQPQVMGILNVTPDSFSDGGDFYSVDTALSHARQMERDGAAIIDIGGESTRPGARDVSEQRELDRVIPIIETLAAELTIPISIDTSKAIVMGEAVSAGAGMINDVMALRGVGAREVASKLSVPICLMHMLGEPRTMQQKPLYDDVVKDVKSFLMREVSACESAGISRERLVLDPGFGFGKTLQHNLQLLRELDEFCDLKMPLLVGASRKSMIGTILGEVPADKRLFGSLAVAVMAAQRGANIIRAHDVRATVDVMKVVAATLI